MAHEEQPQGRQEQRPEEGARGQWRVDTKDLQEGWETITADAYVCAGDVPGIQRLIPQDWRKMPIFDNIFRLEAVPVATVQLRFDGWVTELNGKGRGFPRPRMPILRMAGGTCARLRASDVWRNSSA